MFLYEIFDAPYELKTNTTFSKHVFELILGNIPNINEKLAKIEIYHEPIEQTPEGAPLITNRSPVNVFILEQGLDGVWEGHHVLWSRSQFDSQKTRSGQRLNLKPGPSPRYISTVISLLRPKLEAGEPIRIVASKQYQFWEIYSKLIQRMLKRTGGKYVADPVDTNYRTTDGVQRIAQVIRPAPTASKN